MRARRSESACIGRQYWKIPALSFFFLIEKSYWQIKHFHAKPYFTTIWALWWILVGWGWCWRDADVMMTSLFSEIWDRTKLVTGITFEQKEIESWLTHHFLHNRLTCSQKQYAEIFWQSNLLTSAIYAPNHQAKVRLNDSDYSHTFRKNFFHLRDFPNILHLPPTKLEYFPF